MDRYEYKLKIEQIGKLVARKDFKTALQIAESMDFRREKDVKVLTQVSEVYAENEKYDDAIELMLQAYDNAPIGKRIIYRLTELALLSGKPEEAEAYYKEFVHIAPEDQSRYILRYRIDKAKEKPIGTLIKTLEDYKEEDFDEKWAYELASLYDEAGMGKDCVKLCDEIILWFSLGKYVDKALELKVKYAPLTDSQREKIENKAKFEEQLHQVQMEYGTYEEPEEGEKPVDGMEEENTDRTFDIRSRVVGPDGEAFDSVEELGSEDDEEFEENFEADADENSDDEFEDVTDDVEAGDEDVEAEDSEDEEFGDEDIEEVDLEEEDSEEKDTEEDTEDDPAEDEESAESDDESDEDAEAEEEETPESPIAEDGKKEITDFPTAIHVEPDQESILSAKVEKKTKALIGENENLDPLTRELIWGISDYPGDEDGDGLTPLEEMLLDLESRENDRKRLKEEEEKWISEEEEKLKNKRAEEVRICQEQMAQRMKEEAEAREQAAQTVRESYEQECRKMREAFDEKSPEDRLFDIVSDDGRSSGRKMKDIGSLLDQVIVVGDLNSFIGKLQNDYEDAEEPEKVQPADDTKTEITVAPETAETEEKETEVEAEPENTVTEAEETEAEAEPVVPVQKPVTPIPVIVPVVPVPKAVAPAAPAAATAAATKAPAPITPVIPVPKQAAPAASAAPVENVKPVAPAPVQSSKPAEAVPEKDQESDGMTPEQRAEALWQADLAASIQHLKNEEEAKAAFAAATANDANKDKIGVIDESDINDNESEYVIAPSEKEAPESGEVLAQKLVIEALVAKVTEKAENRSAAAAVPEVAPEPEPIPEPEPEPEPVSEPEPESIPEPEEPFVPSADDIVAEALKSVYETEPEQDNDTESSSVGSETEDLRSVLGIIAEKESESDDRSFEERLEESLKTENQDEEESAEESDDEPEEPEEESAEESGDESGDDGEPEEESEEQSDEEPGEEEETSGEPEKDSEGETNENGGEYATQLDYERDVESKPGNYTHLFVKSDKPEAGYRYAVDYLRKLPEMERPQAVAKTTGPKLNTKGIMKSADKLADHVVIVEQAGALTQERLEEMYQFLQVHGNKCLVVLIDSQLAVEKTKKKHPMLAQMVRKELLYVDMSADELVQHAKIYAAEQDCVIDEMGTLALYSIIEHSMKNTDGSLLSEVDEIVDDAIEYAERISVSNIFGGVFGSKYNKDGQLILKEKYFNKVKKDRE